MKTARLTVIAMWMAALMMVAACSSSSGLGRHSGQMQQDETKARSGSQKKDKARKGKDAADKQQGNASAADTAKVHRDAVDKEEVLQQVEDNSQQGPFITSKIKFAVEVGARQMTLTGNLRMKRNDVIRLQLMAFGFVEAGRLEFTKDYVLIVDRINKQFLQVPYAQLDFLRNSNIDFYTIQSLFWNELCQPGREKMSERQAKKLNAEYSLGDDVVLSYNEGKLSYRWLTNDKNGRIKMANIMYNDNYRGRYQLNWDYEEFKAFERKFFPTRHYVTFTTPDKEVKFEMKLNYLGKEDDWETRTKLSGKYRQVSVDEILRRFMSL